MKDIIVELKNGNYHVLDRLYLETKPKFVAWAKNKFHLPESDIVDAWQDALTIFYEQIVDGRLTELSVEPYTYIYAIGKNVLLNKLKKSSREISAEMLKYEEFEEFIWTDMLEEPRSEEYLQMQKAIALLSDTNRNLLIKRYYDGLSIEQIKERDGYASLNAVSASLSRALSQLKSLIKLK